MESENYALITGATSGIGYALAMEFAKNGIPLVLISRNQQKLSEIAGIFKEKYKIDVIVFQNDLLKEGTANQIYEQVKNQGINIQILINNAGFNEAGMFIHTNLKKEVEMIRIHNTIVIELTKLFLPGMVEKKYGRIVLLGSTASFQPVPGNAVYGAAKAFIYNYSRAIRYELRGTGVKITTLCPGATLTNFQYEAGISNTRLFSYFPMKPEKVAKVAYPKIMKGVKTIVPGLQNKFIAISPWFTPPFIRNKISLWLYQSIKNR